MYHLEYHKHFAILIIVNEDKIQQQRRDHDESATQQRAAILGIQYLDLRPLEAQIPLTMNVLSVADMYKHKVVPLKHDENENKNQDCKKFLHCSFLSIFYQLLKL